MKISEGYNVAVKKYGQEIADIMKEVGMPKAFIDTACRFYVEDGISIETLQDDFKKWNRYVLNNPSFTAKGNNNLNVFKTYLDFKRELQKAMMPFICPNPIYDDGNLSMGELKTQRDARWFPIQNFAFPDENNDYCISKKVGGYKQFQKYHQDGCKMLIIYDKGKSSHDEFKRVLVMAKNGELRFWNNFDAPCGTTKRLSDPIWAYIDTLPHKAQIALSEFAESTLETNDMINNKIDKNESKNMSKKNTIRLSESDLKRVISESVKRVISELDYKTYANAASAAKDRENIFKNDPGYPDRPMRRHYKDDGSLDMERYQRDSDWQVNQSKQPKKFKDAAYKELSKSICGQEDFIAYLCDYLKTNDADENIANMVLQYQQGDNYIKNNKTQWSKRR